VKQDKRQEFENAVKKYAEVNRRNGGDQWIAFSTIYGAQQGTVHFASLRENMAAVDTAYEATDKALAKGVGTANLPKFFASYFATIMDERGEIRMRRPDLSFNFPDTPEGRTRMVAESKFMRSSIVRAKPGMTPGLTDIWKKIRSSMETEGAKHAVAVSQATTGPSGVFYFTSYAKSLGEFDSQHFDLAKAMGEEAYRSLQKDISEVVAESRVDIYRMSRN